MPSNTEPKTDVLHSTGHSHLTQEEIARAVARHNREHPKASAKRPQKTTPRG